jgi:RNA polymerase sigma factor (sigma-70 family)
MLQNTPKTLISQIFKPGDGLNHNRNWKSFFDIYHPFIRSSISLSLITRNWRDVNEHVLEEITSDVLVSLVKNKKPFDRSKNFKGLLKQIIDRRVIDYIKKQNQAKNQVNPDLDSPIGNDDSGQTLNDILSMENPDGTYITETKHKVNNRRQINISYGEVERNGRYATLRDMVNAVKDSVPPRTYSIFERIKIYEEDVTHVMKDMNLNRGQVDNAIYKFTKKLKELAQTEEYRKELIND